MRGIEDSRGKGNKVAPTVQKHLFTGSLQDHMRASRKEMNQSYVNQQNQLMSMNVVREAQRLQLSQAETIVKLNQLKEEVIKALPPKNVRVVIPTSNAALESTLDTPKEELEEKQAPVTKSKPASINTKSIPNLAAQVLASKDKPSAVTSPTASEASEAPTVSTSTTAQGNVGSPREELDTKQHFGRSKTTLRDAVSRSKMDDDQKTEALLEINKQNSVADLKKIEQAWIADPELNFEASDFIGNGLRASRSGVRGKQKISLIRGKNGRFTKR